MVLANFFDFKVGYDITCFKLFLDEDLSCKIYYEMGDLVIIIKIKLLYIIVMLAQMLVLVIIVNEIVYYCDARVRACVDYDSKWNRL